MSERRSLRARFDLVPGMHRARPVRTGLVALGIAAVVLYCGFTVSIPFVPKGAAVVRAEFERAASVRPGTPVRVHGVNVGEVEKVAQGPGGRGAVLTLRVKHGMGVDVHADARAAIWWRTLLARNMYVELDPGSASAPALGGATIPRSRTTTQTELDEVLSVLDPTGRKAVQTTLREFDRGLGEPAAVGGTVDALEPAMREVSPAMRALRGTRTGDLNRLVVGTSRAMGALASHENALGGLIDSGAVSLGVTAAQRAQLGTAIAAAPASLRQTRATMRRLRTTLDVLDPLAAQLRPGARRLAPATGAARPALTALDRLLARAEPTLVRLRPTLESLADLAPDARRMVQDAKAPVDRTHDEIIPFLNQRDPSIKLRNFEAIGPTLSVVDSATSQFDRYGHIIRFQAGVSEQALGTSPCTTFLLDPTAKQKVDCSLLTDAMKAVLGMAPPPHRAKTNGGRGG
jgi:virulence factor Mce-like protein